MTSLGNGYYSVMDKDGHPHNVFISSPDTGAHCCRSRGQRGCLQFEASHWISCRHMVTFQTLSSLMSQKNRSVAAT